MNPNKSAFKFTTLEDYLKLTIAMIPPTVQLIFYIMFNNDMADGK